MTEIKTERLLDLPKTVPWGDSEQRRKIEAELRDRGQIGVVEKDGSLKVREVSEFIPSRIFTTKWNSATVTLPNGTTYSDPLPIDFGLVPNPHDRLGFKDIELLTNIKYAVEGETALVATVQEDGQLKVTHVGAYQDMSDRDVSPAGKVWGKGKVAGMGPLWLEIDGWEDIEGAQMNANIVGINKDGVDGEAPRIVSIPADIKQLSRYWGKDFERKLRDHDVYKDLHLKPGDRVMFTTGLLYWEQDYEVRYFNTAQTPDIEMVSTLTLRDGREIESVMKAHSIEYVSPELTNEQAYAKSFWVQKYKYGVVPVNASKVPKTAEAAYLQAFNAQHAKGKIIRLVSDAAFVVSANPSVEDIKQLLPEYEELHMKYEAARKRMKEVGAGIEITLIKNGDTFAEKEGVLGGVIVNSDGVVMDDIITKRGVQRSYDVGSDHLWNQPSPDLVFASGRTASLATVEVALQTAGEPYPRAEIIRDWRLNEREFGVGKGQKETEFNPEKLYSFVQAIEGAENFSLVHLKTVDFLVDLIEAANDFKTAHGRNLRVIIATHEGPMQIMKAVLSGKPTKEGMFEPIESTQTEKHIIQEPFIWPEFTDNLEICLGMDRPECDGIIAVSTKDASRLSLGLNAAEMVARLIQQEGNLTPLQQEAVQMSIEDLAPKDGRHMERLIEGLETLVESVGVNRFMEASQRLTDRLNASGREDERSHENLTLVDVLQTMRGFAAHYA